jgi:hypothetical protein
MREGSGWIILAVLGFSILAAVFFIWRGRVKQRDLMRGRSDYPRHRGKR